MRNKLKMQLKVVELEERIAMLEEKQGILLEAIHKIKRGKI